MPRRLDLSGITADQVRNMITQPGGRFSRGAAEQYLEAFPELSAELAPFLGAPPQNTTAQPSPTAAVTPGAATAQVPGTTPTGTAAPDFLSQWDEINSLLQNRQTLANMGRIPMGADLEESSSRGIMELLNPPNQFAEVDRRSAELAAMRGIPGSAAGQTAGYRMTDEERLRRMALGQQFLSAATQRNPSVPISASDALATVITPYQQQQLDQQWKQIEIQLRQLGLTEDQIDLARDRFDLERATAARTGVVTDASGNPAAQQFNIAGTGWAPNWVTFDPITGRWG